MKKLNLEQMTVLEGGLSLGFGLELEIGDLLDNLSDFADDLIDLDVEV